MSTRTIPQPATETLTLDYYLAGDVLIIASATVPGRLYVTTAKDCSCPIGLEEWPCAHADLRLRLRSPQAHDPYPLDLDALP
ncbi:MAG TPA: hypothetical protein VFZ66_18890 [Herpetosiphonaceae bacterium]